MILFRRLARGELSVYRDHLLRLSCADRRARFCGAVGDATVEAHCASVDGRGTLLLGCFGEGGLKAAAELCFDGPARPGGAELALSVDAAFQGRGIGAALARRALTIARNRAVREVRLLCLADNARMKALIRRVGGRFQVEDGEVAATVALSWPDQISLWQEAVDTGTTLAGGILSGDALAAMGTVTSPFVPRFALPLPFRFPVPPSLSRAA